MARKLPTKSNDKTNLTPDELISQLKKSYSTKATIGLGNIDEDFEVLPTGSLGLDVGLGIGGIPSGRIVEIAGSESSGKTTIALKIAAQAQRAGHKVAFIDTEHALDPTWAMQLGVDLDPEVFLYLAPENLEYAGDMLVDIAQSGIYKCMLFDSVAGAAINAVLEGDLGDANMGKRAKIMSDFMPKLNPFVKANKLWMIFTNQMRTALDQYHRGTGGQMTSDVLPGGKALDYHASIIIKLKNERPKMDDLKKAEDEGMGYTNIKFDIIKNKMAPPYRVGTYKLYFDGSIDNYTELADLVLLPTNLDALGIDKRGAWYYIPVDIVSPDYRDEAKDGLVGFQGAAKVAEMLTSDMENFNKLVVGVRRRLIKYGDSKSVLYDESA